jgi:superfamily I DNA/RNA helicase
VNYRTTDEIRQWACAQLEGCAVDDLDGNADSLRGYRSLTHGDAPDIIGSMSQQDDVTHIQTILKQLQDDGMELRQVCISARTNDDVDGIARALQLSGVACLKLENSTADDSAAPGVRLATMHRIKGLEFSVVILAAYKGAENYADQFSRDEDAGVTEDTELSERCLLHVAATRAKRNLFVLMRSS